MSKHIAKKFFVLYCPKNLYRPAIYTTKVSVSQKIKKLNQLQFNQFDSEIQAQKFAFQKKMHFFLLREQMEKIQNNKLMAQNSVQKATLQQKANSQSEDQAPKQSKLSQKQKDTTAQKQIQKQEEVEVENEQETQQQNINLLLNIAQISKNMKQMAKIIVVEKELQKAWKQIMYKFDQKSPKLRNLQKNSEYYAFFDGCSKQNPGPSGAGYHVLSGHSKTIIKRSFNLGWKTNNQAEYLALILLLMDCYLNGIKKLQVRGDSNLVVQGIKQKFNIKHDNIKYLNVIALHLSKKFQKMNIERIDRQQNKIADNLANQGLKKRSRASKSINKQQNK